MTTTQTTQIRSFVPAGGTRPVLIDTRILSQDAPLEHRPREKIIKLIQKLGTEILPQDNATVIRMTAPKKDIDDWIEIPTPISTLEWIRISNQQVKPDNPGYSDLCDHFETPAEDRNDDWVAQLKVLLRCATLHKISKAFGNDREEGLPIYNISPVVAGRFMMQKVANFGEGVEMRDKMDKVRKLFDNTDIGPLFSLMEGLASTVKNSHIYVIGAAVMRMHNILLSILLSEVGEFKRQAFLGIPAVQGKLTKGFFKDLMDIIPFLHVCINDEEDSEASLMIVWRIFGQLGFPLNIRKYPCEPPKLSAEDIHAVLTCFIASSSLRLLQPDDVTITPDLFDAIVLSAVRALTTKGEAAALRSSAKKAGTAAGMLAATEATAELGSALATAAAKSIRSALQTQAVRNFTIPPGMDVRLVSMISALMERISKLKTSDVGKLDPAIQRVLNDLNAAGILGFNANADITRAYSNGLRPRIIPEPVDRSDAKEGWLHSAVETFLTKLTSDGMKEKRCKVKESLIRYLVQPVTAANEFAPKYIVRKQSQDQKAQEKRSDKRKALEGELMAQAATGTLVATAKVRRLLGKALDLPGGN